MSAGEAALHPVIWLSLLLFAIGEAGARGPHSLRFDWRSPWALWTAGAVLCGAHMVVAFGVRHGWSHADAVRTTAEQTAAVYGLWWGGGVYVNYAFLAAWASEALWWRAAPSRYLSRPAWLRLGVRAFYLVIVINAAIVFVPAERRIAGIVLSGVLLWIWLRPPAPERSLSPTDS